MDSLKVYALYYWAFEDAYDNDVWDDVITYFTDDAIYKSPMVGEVKGKENIMSVFQTSLNRFDRKFSVKRTIKEIKEEKIVEENYLKVPGIVTYGNENCSDLVVTMTEEVWFKNGLIEKIVDDIPLSERIKIQQYLEEYKNELK